jgi:hypothetical protein
MVGGVRRILPPLPAFVQSRNEELGGLLLVRSVTRSERARGLVAVQMEAQNTLCECVDQIVFRRRRKSRVQCRG